MRTFVWTVAAASFLGIAGQARAAIMLDMGPTATIASPANSPAHFIGAVPSTETTWNTVLNTNLASGNVLNSNGTIATGVSVTIGDGSNTAGVIDFTAPNNAATLTGSSGPTVGTDYSGTAAQDGNFKSGAAGGSLTASVGMRIDGLAAGTYTVYGVLRNTNTSNATSNESLYAVAGATATTFNFGALTPVNVGNSEATGNNTWVAGDQYGTAMVTLAAGQSLYVIANGGVGSAESRGMMNAIQIVAPEPAGASLALAGAVIGFARRRRRR
jgi:hypothetical protein